ncbi:MAG: DUF5069 domain-containing protein [Verrucomicrobia bacterium]|nr:DUF5069 domain-containing protein [Verrucomicrobiota bacterium]
MIQPKDLTKEPPRSPRERLAGYAVLGRALDKGRALLAGKVGEYHFNCPLDNMLFDFKGVTGDQVKELLEQGATDEEVTAWLSAHGTPRSQQEVESWASTLEQARPYDDPERREWFAEQCAQVGLDPARTTLFEWLEADDRASFTR